MKIARIKNNKLYLKNELIEYIPPSVDISTGKSSGMTASSMYNSSYGPSNLVDGNISFEGGTAFACANNAPLPQWHQVDLGKTYYVNKVRWINNRVSARLPGDYKIEVSSNGIFGGEQILVASNENNTLFTWIEHTFPDIKCRYVRMTVTRIYSGTYYELAEWQIWGYDSKDRDKISFKNEHIIVDEIIEYPQELSGGRNLLEGSEDLNRSWETDSWGTYNYLLRVDIASIFPKIKVGDTLTFSFDVKMEIGSILKVYDSNGHPDISYGSQTFNNIGSSEQRLSFTKTLVKGTRNTTIWYMDFYNNNNGDKFSISNIKIEFGDRTTSWTIAPEDLELEYYDYIQNFNPRILRNGAVLINEFIEEVNL